MTVALVFLVAGLVVVNPLTSRVYVVGAVVGWVLLAGAVVAGVV